MCGAGRRVVVGGGGGGGAGRRGRVENLEKQKQKNFSGFTPVSLAC